MGLSLKDIGGIVDPGTTGVQDLVGGDSASGAAHKVLDPLGASGPNGSMAKAMGLNDIPAVPGVPAMPVWQTAYATAGQTKTNFGGQNDPNMQATLNAPHAAVLMAATPPPAPPPVRAGDAGAAVGITHNPGSGNGSGAGFVTGSGDAYTLSGGSILKNGATTGTLTGLNAANFGGMDMSSTYGADPGDLIAAQQGKGLMANIKAQYGATKNTVVTPSAMTVPTSTVKIPKIATTEPVKSNRITL
jgi:hypothetical protein